MARQLGQVIAERTAGRLVGRQSELERLDALLHADGPVVAFVHGLAGIGKTTLVHAFADRARADEARVIVLDGAGIEPSSGGFMRALSEALGVDDALSEPSGLRERLDSFDAPVVVVIDVYERLRLLDTWLRRDFVPSLPSSCRVVIAGREPPLIGWQATFSVAGAFIEIPLEGLSHEEAIELLAAAALPPEQSQAIVRLTHGHPLAVQLAAEVARSGAIGDVVVRTRTRLIQDLAVAYLGDLAPDTRQALEAASVVRRVTRSLLAALLPDRPPADVFDRLAGLPFVARTEEGLALHDLVHDVVQASLRADDPVAYRTYRTAAWEQLTAEARSAGRATLWRYTADMLALIENPVVREAFFPAATSFLAVEPARPADEPAIRALVDESERPTAAESLHRFRDARPDSWSVVRDDRGEVVGLYALCRQDEIPASVLDDHPIMRLWRTHLRHHPVGPDELVLFMPRWLSSGFGEAACPAQAASWLDVKRIYMELRPHLRRLYTVVTDLAAWAPVVLPLGFTPLADLDVELDGQTYHTALLDFGPGSVDGWLAVRVAGELGVTGEVLLDPSDRTVRTVDGRVALSKLEFGVLEVLRARMGQPVSREQMLRSVWGTDYAEGSNVVDAVVRTLRGKLGDDAGSIETVRGIGYRYRR